MQNKVRNKLLRSNLLDLVLERNKCAQVPQHLVRTTRNEAQFHPVCSHIPSLAPVEDRVLVHQLFRLRRLVLVFVHERLEFLDVVRVHTATRICPRRTVQ